MLLVLATTLWFSNINNLPPQTLQQNQIETPHDIQPALGGYVLQHSIKVNSLQGN